MRQTLLCFVFLALVGTVALSPVAGAQPVLPRIDPQPSLNEASSLEHVHDVLVGTVRGRLNIRYNPKRSGPVTGLILGDRLEGYRTFDAATKAQSLAFIRFKRNAQNVEIAAQVFTGDASPTQRSWMGVAHALDVPLGGASAGGNAVSFRAVGPIGRLCAGDPACVAANNVLRPLPVVANPIAIDAAAMAGFGINANGHRGPLVVRAAAGGNNEGVLSGHVLGDTLTGHYARGAGTIVLLRHANGRPIQVFTGVLDAGGVKGGRGLPLNASGGDGPFDWRVVTNDQIVSGLRSLHTRERCLTPDDPAGGPGTILTTTTGCGNVNTSWVVFATGRNGANTVYSLVSVASGLCLQMPMMHGSAVVQQVCNGARTQALGIFELEQTGTQQGGFPIFTDVALNTTAAFASSGRALNLYVPGNGGSACLGIVGTTGAVVETACSGLIPGRMAVERESKAGWTHDP